MTGDSKPERLWSSEYGRNWTEDNELSTTEIDELYRERFGVSQRELMERFLGHLNRDARILEVGANMGVQLLCLEEMGFTQLFGIDIQREAIEAAHRNRPELDIIEGNLFDIPFKDNYFDVVFTNGVLIHVPPEKLEIALDEITRCTNRWIYGHEYYAEEYTEITHRGHDGVLWKTDYPTHYVEGRDLELKDIEHLEHADSDNVDVAFLIEQ